MKHKRLMAGVRRRGNPLRLSGRRARTQRVPATQIAIEKGTHQAANTGVFGELMEGLEPRAAPRGVRQRFRVTFAKKPKLIPLNLAILEAGAQAVRVLRMVE